MKLQTYLKRIKELAEADYLTLKEELKCPDELKSIIETMRADMFNYLAEIEDVIKKSE